MTTDKKTTRAAYDAAIATLREYKTWSDELAAARAKYHETQAAFEAAAAAMEIAAAGMHAVNNRAHPNVDAREQAQQTVVEWVMDEEPDSVSEYDAVLTTLKRCADTCLVYPSINDGVVNVVATFGYLQLLFAFVNGKLSYVKQHSHG